MDTYYEPVQKGEDYWVYAELKEKELHLHVGNSMVRMFNLTQLPDHIRSQLAMVHTQVWEELLWFPYEDIKTFPMWYPEQYEDIGWKLSYHKYVLVLPEKVLEELRGEVSRG